MSELSGPPGAEIVDIRWRAVAEIQRLEGEVFQLKKRLEGSIDLRRALALALAEMPALAFAAGQADGAQEEREAVVHWLRTYANAMDEHLADILADEIAEGSHRLEHRKP